MFTLHCLGAEARDGVTSSSLGLVVTGELRPEAGLAARRAIKASKVLGLGSRLYLLTGGSNMIDNSL